MEIPDVDIICITHQQYNDKRIKANKSDFCFCGDNEKSHFEWLHNELL